MFHRKSAPIVLLCCVIAVFIIFKTIAGSKPAIAAKFSDGTTAKIEKVTFGRKHEYSEGSRLYNQLIRYWPNFLPKLPASTYLPFKFETAADELAIWFSLSTTSNAAMPRFAEVHIEDEHGCIFGSGTSRTCDYQFVNRQLMGERFSTYPRSQTEFKMVVEQRGGFGPRSAQSVTLDVRNPKVMKPVEWKPEPLPIARQSGDFKVTLKQIDATYTTPNFSPSFFRNASPPKRRMRFDPQFAMEQNGKPTQAITNRFISYSDATGNRDSSILCIHEPAIKMEAEFARTQDASFDANEISTSPEFSVPAPGTIQKTPFSCTIDGASFQLETMIGPGVTTFSNSVPVKAKAPDGALLSFDIVPLPAASGSPQSKSTEVKSEHVVMGIRVSGLKPEQDLLVFGIDDQGCKLPAYGYGNTPEGVQLYHALNNRGERAFVSGRETQPNAICFLFLPIEKPSKHIRISFAVQKRFKMEFMFKPSAQVKEFVSQAMPSNGYRFPVARGNGNGFIEGIPAKQYRHKTARNFLNSLAKDTYEGQKIASELIKNGMGIEYLPQIYMDTYHLSFIKDNGWAGNGDYAAVIESMRFRSFNDYLESFRLPPFTNKVLLEQLFELRPTRSYYSSNFRMDNKIMEPEEEWFSEKDVLNYIKEHPAARIVFPVTLNIAENLGSQPASTNAINDKTFASAPGLIQGIPEKKYRHVTAWYFLQSAGCKTWEGQKIATELVANGIGIEYIPFIYRDSKWLGGRKKINDRMPSQPDITAEKRAEFLSEYCSAKGRKGLPQFPNRKLLESLLDLHPQKEYESTDMQAVTRVIEPESEWLSHADVMKFIKEHPAQPTGKSP